MPGGLSPLPLMHGAEGIQISGHFVILVMFPVSQICAALMCYRLEGKKKKVVSVSTHGFISYSCVLPPRAQS